MCTLVEEYANDVRAEAEIKAKVESVDNCSKLLGVSIERACELIGITVDKYHAAKTMMMLS